MLFDTENEQLTLTESLKNSIDILEQGAQIDQIERQEGITQHTKEMRR